tara:strand:+ start:200 stop:427 length:228 start_codon:yes stop_codon:yes gene_type:complete
MKNQTIENHESCPHGCITSDEMDNEIWEKFGTKEREELKTQWEKYGGWCEHWCAKWGYEEIWLELKESARENTIH